MATVNFNSLDSCKAAWINYTYENNTQKISDADIAKIKEMYGSQLAGWKPIASVDQNEYEIEDETPKANDSSKTSLAVTSGTVVAGAVATKAANNAAINGVIKGGGTFVNSTGQQIATPKGGVFKADTFQAFNPNDKTAVGMADKANNTSATGFMIECTLGLATGIVYEARKANKDEYAKLMDMEEQMQAYLSELEDTESTMEDDASIISELTETAENISEDAAVEIEKLQKELDEKTARRDELVAKNESGVQLTKAEQDEVEVLTGEIADLTDKIALLRDESNDEVEEVSEENEQVQEDLEEASDSVADIQELADSAASFDEDTKKMCVLESVAQGLNVVSSTKGAVSAFSFAASGAALFGSTLWANAFGVMGVTGAALSAKGVIEQAKFAADISDEIKIRKEVQSLSADAANAIDENAVDLDLEIDIVDTTVEDLAAVDVEPAVVSEPDLVDNNDPEADEQIDKKKVEEEPTV